MISQTPHIRIVGVSKSYGAATALRNINLDIQKGEFFSLLGPSGCGKTTLLKMLGGFERPTEGDILINGVRANDVPAHKRQTNMVFQSYALFPHLDVAGNVGYGLRRSRLSKAEKRDKIQGLIDLMQLGGLEARNVNNLSGGQKQRVALARALAMDPLVLLLDEPLGALDKKLRDQMQVELRSIQQRVGITFVFVTHDQEEAMALSDRVAVLFDGEVAQVDTPQNLYNHPRSEAVASFIGTINLFDGRIRAVDDAEVTVDVAGLETIRLRSDGTRAFGQADEVRVAIRPERIAISSADVGQDRVTGKARVTSVSFRGDRSYLELQVSGLGNNISVVMPSGALSGGDLPGIGETVTFSFCGDDAILV